MCAGASPDINRGSGFHDPYLGYVPDCMLSYRACFLYFI